MTVERGPFVRAGAWVWFALSMMNPFAGGENPTEETLDFHH
jgi:hypothetical protein